MVNQPLSSFSMLISHNHVFMTKFWLIIIISLLGNSYFGYSSSDAKKVDSKILTEKLGTNRTLKVDIEGKAEFTSIQQAINSVPDGNSEWIIINIRKGIYREKVHIPKTKPYIYLRGDGKGKTHITSNQNSVDNIESATFVVEASNFVAFGVSFKNEAPTGIAFTSQNQSVAAVVSGDKISFYRCAFFSTHNTLFDYKGSHYYDNCYIQGSIDFIFGRAASIFQSCEIFVISDKRVKPFGSITAHNRVSEKEKTGYIFNEAKVYGIDLVYLGRAKGSYSRVIFANSYMSKTIVPPGWTNWSNESNTQNLFQAEYKCHGPGAVIEGRVPWAKQLTKEEVDPFLSIDFINGKEWIPVWNV